MTHHADHLSASSAPSTASAPSDDARRAALYESLVEDAFDFMVAIRDDFEVHYASKGITDRIGLPPEAMVDRSVADFLHPEDLDRALLHMDGWDRSGAPGGTTTFRILHADGSYRPYDVTAAKVTDGVESYLAVYCRPVDYQQATDEVMSRLLQGASRADALRPVLDVFSWEINDSSIAIAWYEPGEGHQFVSTGIPRELTGADDEPGHIWAKVRETGEPLMDLDRSHFEPHLDALAEEYGRGGCWVMPVPDAGSGVPALITVWARPDIGRPDGHAYGMTMAHAYVELILRWSSHLSALNQAALHDPLTNVWNRKALFDAFDDQPQGGALLFCDLDRFKPINDAHGHTAGDKVLVQIARRIEGAVRSGDLVARTGGDEFVILAPGATLEQAAALAQRIRTAVSQPIALGSATLHVGVTIGVAHADEALTDATLAGADEALMLAKASARGTVRWAPGAMPGGDQERPRPDQPSADRSVTTTE